MQLFRLLTAKKTEELGWRAEAVEAAPPHLTLEERRQADRLLKYVQDNFEHLLEVGG